MQPALQHGPRALQHGPGLPKRRRVSNEQRGPMVYALWACVASKESRQRVKVPSRGMLFCAPRRRARAQALRLAGLPCARMPAAQCAAQRSSTACQWCQWCHQCVNVNGVNEVILLAMAARHWLSLCRAPYLSLISALPTCEQSPERERGRDWRERARLEGGGRPCDFLPAFAARRNPSLMN